MFNRRPGVDFNIRLAAASLILAALRQLYALFSRDRLELTILVEIYNLLILDIDDQVFGPITVQIVETQQHRRLILTRAKQVWSGQRAGLAGIAAGDLDD